MRVLRWAALGAVVVWMVLFVWSTIGERTLPVWVLYAPWEVFGVLALVAVVRDLLPGRRGGIVRRMVGPGFRGLGDVQDIYFGRTPGILPTYGSDEPDVPALVEPHPDPLDEPRWVLRSTADGHASASGPDRRGPSASQR